MILIQCYYLVSIHLETGINHPLCFALFVGRQLMNFFICSGVDPSEQSDFPSKVNTPMVGTMAMSIVLQTVIQVKIWVSKWKTNSIHLSNTSNLKLNFYNTFINHSLSGFATNILGVCIGVGAIFFVSIINKFSPAELNMYPNYYYVYALQLYVPVGFGGFFCISVYLRNKQMITCIKKEVRERLERYDLF